MRYELNFDEDKVIDIEAIGDDGVLDLNDCCKIMNEQQATIKQQEKIIKEQTLRTYCQDKEIQKLLQQIKELKET